MAAALAGFVGLRPAVRHPKPKRSAQPRLEELENLTLPAAWQPLGPAPLYNPPQPGVPAIDTSAPWAGRVDAITTSAYDNARGTFDLYAGTTGGGVWVSRDSYSAQTGYNDNPTWQPLTDQVESGFVNAATGLGTGANRIGFGSVVVLEPTDGNPPAVVAATSGGVLKSLDNGATWRFAPVGATAPGGDVTSKQFDQKIIFKVIADPSQPRRLFAAVAGLPNGFWLDADDQSGVYVSEDAGETWTMMNTAIEIGLQIAVTDLDYTVSSDGVVTVFAGVRQLPSVPGHLRGDSGVYKCVLTAGDYHWQKCDLGAGLTPAPDKFQRIGLAARHSPGDQLVFAAIVGDPGGGGIGLLHILRSKESGADGSWESLPKPPVDPTQVSGFLDFGMSPSGRLYLGGLRKWYVPNAEIGAFESNLAGDSWRRIDAVQPGMTFPHTDAESWGFDAFGTVYQGNDGGIYRYDPYVLDPAVNVETGRPAWGVGVASIANRTYPPDILVANPDVAQLGSINNNGGGQFNLSNGRYFPTSAGGAVATADLTGSGLADFIVANWNANTVTVLRNTPDGVQRVQDPIPVGVNPGALAVGNITGNGTQDIVVANYNGNSLTILQGSRANPGTFSVWRTISTGAGTIPYDVKIDDFDGDGTPDLVVSLKGANQLAFYPGLVAGGFGPAVRFGNGSGPRGMTVAKLDNDGRPDLAVAYGGDGTVRTFLATGDAAAPFTLADTVAVGVAPWDVAAGDFNRDLKTDLVVALNGSQGIRLLYGRGDGTFARGGTYYHTGTQPTSVTVVDLNATCADTDVPDVIVTHADGRVSILMGNELLASNPQAPIYQGNWYNLNTEGLNTLLVDSVDRDPLDSRVIVEAAFDNGFGRTTGGNWYGGAGGDGYQIRFDPDIRNHPGVVYAMSQNGAITRSSDDGSTFDEVLHPTAQAGVPFQSVFDLSQTTDWIVMGSMDGVWAHHRSLAQPSWIGIGPMRWAVGGGVQARDTSGVTALVYAPNNGSVVYAGFGDGQLFRTAASGGVSGTAWVNADGRLLAPGAPAPPAWGLWRRVSALAVGTTDAQIVFVGIGARPTGANAGLVWASTDGGLHFENITGNLPTLVPVNCLALDDSQRNDPILYAGTDAGVYVGRKVLGFWYWQRLGTDLPFVKVTDLRLTGSTLLTAATYGRGVWEIQLQPRRVVQGQAWVDVVGGGVYRPGEPAKAGVTVNLLDAQNTIVATTLTAFDGSYKFFEMAPGVYSVQFVAPTGFHFTAKNQGDGTNDSQADPNTGITDPFDVQGFVDYVNVGLAPDSAVPYGTVSGLAWLDSNGDGLQQMSETNLTGVTVWLYAADGTQVGQNTTDANGKYQFSGVPTGNYYVEFLPPVGDSLSPSGQASDPDPDTGRTAVFALGDAQTVSLSAGCVPPAALPATATVSGHVWYDLDGNGAQNAGEPDLQSVEVDLTDSSGNLAAETQTAADGTYQLDGIWAGSYSLTFVHTLDDGSQQTIQGGSLTLSAGQTSGGHDAGFVPPAAPPVTAITGLAWLDNNADGIRDGNETAAANIVVQLLNSGGTVLDEMVTGDDGSYHFDVAPGQYRVEFLPDIEFALSPQHQGSDPSVDSDPNPQTYQTAVLTVAQGQTLAHVDAGIYDWWTHSGPYAEDDKGVTTVNVPVSVDVLKNDFDPDGDPVSIVSVGQPSHGTAQLNSDLFSITYTPDTGYIGSDSYQYTINDGHGGTATATVSIVVGEPQLANGGASTAQGEVAALTDAQLNAAVARGIALLSTSADVSALAHLDVRIADLQGGILGVTYQHTIWISRDAAGRGWFTDVSVGSDALFGQAGAGQDRLAKLGSAAFYQFDLLTVVTHELEHVLGKASIDAAVLPHDLMTATIDVGMRRTATASPLEVLPESLPPAGPSSATNQAVFQAAGPATDLFTSGWLLDRRAPLDVTAPAATTADMKTVTYQWPGNASWLNPKTAEPVSSQATVTAPPAGTDLLLAIQRGADDPDVLVGGTGDDIQVGGQGRDLLIGGWGRESRGSAAVGADDLSDAQGQADFFLGEDAADFAGAGLL